MPITVPIRTCVGCRQRRPQPELVRCTLGADGVARIDRAAPGRGAWLCRGSRECFDLAVRRRAFDRAWRRPVITAALEQLRRLLEEQEATLSGPDSGMRDLLADGATP